MLFLAVKLHTIELERKIVFSLVSQKVYMNIIGCHIIIDTLRFQSLLFNVHI